MATTKRKLGALQLGLLVPTLWLGSASGVRGDEVLYRYEGDMLPHDAAAGWVVANACDGTCTEAVENGRLVFRWPAAGGSVNYHLWIAKSGEPSPSSLWAEFQLRSNFPLGPYFFSCDARCSVVYQHIFDSLYLYGDAVISRSGSDFVLGLELGEFHTYRFESPDGARFAFFVDGREIWNSIDNDKRDLTYLQFGGSGGCNGDWIPNRVNEWDFVRYGTISDGEQLEATNPPVGALDPRNHAGLDRFLMTFDQPAYVYVSDITVEVTDLITTTAVSPPEIPIVTKTRRREPPDPFDVEDDPRILEIVLDRPIPFNATTRFSFSDGVAANVIEYTFAPADANGTGTVDLADIAYLQNCVGSKETDTLCGVFDLDRDGFVDRVEFLEVVAILMSPAP